MQDFLKPPLLQDSLWVGPAKKQLALRGKGEHNTNREVCPAHFLSRRDRAEVTMSPIAQQPMPSSLFAAAHSGASPRMVATFGPGVIMDAPSRTENDTSLEDSGAPRSRQIASRRCGIAIISSPLRSRAVGPKSRVGADSR